MIKYFIALSLMLALAIPAFAVQVEIAEINRQVFSIERLNITTASVNIDFGFTSGRASRKIFVETPSTNSDDVCIDWFGGTAVCPAANTAGNQRLAPGTSLILDHAAFPDVSVIAASGTQTFKVTAWR